VSNDHIRPSSIEGIKQFAKRLKKSDGIPHAVALEHAAKAAGYGSYKHARRSVGAGSSARQALAILYISVLWRDRTTKATGYEILSMQLEKPLDALVKPAQYKASRGLATMRREAPDHLADTYTASSQELAREAACEAARNNPVYRGDRTRSLKGQTIYPKRGIPKPDARLRS
jgi:hypothetical protein